MRFFWKKTEKQVFTRARIYRVRFFRCRSGKKLPVTGKLMAALTI